MITCSSKILSTERKYNSPRIVAKGDVESLRFFYYAGIKDLGIFVNIDKRTIGHIVRFQNSDKINYYRL